MENVKFKDILSIYESQISKNVKNKKKLLNFERNKFQNLINIYYELKNDDYRMEHYNIFLSYRKVHEKRVFLNFRIDERMYL